MRNTRKLVDLKTSHSEPCTLKLRLPPKSQYQWSMSGKDSGCLKRKTWSAC